MFYGVVNEGFLDRFKKKSSESKADYESLSPEEKKKMNSARMKDINDFIKSTKEEIDKYVNKNKDKILKIIDKGFDNGDLNKNWYKGLYKTNKLPKLEAKYEDNCIVVLDYPQDLRILLEFVCRDLAKIMSKKTGLTVTNGDGDEGCLYPKELLYEKRYYNSIYNKDK